MPGPDCVLGALVAILLVDVSLSLLDLHVVSLALSVLDLHVASLAAFPSVEVPATKMNQLNLAVKDHCTDCSCRRGLQRAYIQCKVFSTLYQSLFVHVQTIIRLSYVAFPDIRLRSSYCTHTCRVQLTRLSPSSSWSGRLLSLSARP